MTRGIIRPGWDEYFLGLARAAAERADCDRGRVGCVLVRDRRVLSTGYAASSACEPGCDAWGHLLSTIPDWNGSPREACVRAVHAERNAVAAAARLGISIHRATAYVTHYPCRDCARLLLAAGVARVVISAAYRPNNPALEPAFARAGVSVEFTEERSTAPESSGFVLRAGDRLTPKVVRGWLILAREAGYPPAEIEAAERFLERADPGPAAPITNPTERRTRS